jgi:hypothetical protein
MPPIQTAPVKYDTIKLLGGLDQVTPTLSLVAGAAREALNFECSVTGGYTRIEGYERIDGQAEPSDAVVQSITLSSVASLAVGNTIQNPGGTVTGVVVGINANDVFYTKAVGTFAVGDTVKVGATTIGTVVTPSGTGVSAYQLATYNSLAADVYRALIGEVPGSGPIRGVAYLNGAVYAWRNNVVGTALGLYKTSSTGWQAVNLGYELAFNTGTGTAIADGDSISNLTGTATGVVSRVVVENGTAWAAATGKLILSSTTGTWAAADQIRVGGVQRATATGAAQAIVPLPGGRVETVTSNMGGANSKTRIYGADGKNRGFEFDGSVYVPIRTGMTVDTPNHVAVHKNYLFFSFGSSVQNSSVAGPYIWNSVLGANEIVLPEDVTCFQSMPGNASTAALAIYTKNNTHMLYGVASGAWNLVPYDKGTGAAAYTAQTITDAYALDDRGVMAMQSSLNYGNFDSSTLTFAIRPWIQARRGMATASGVNREKSQYRVFYSDGSGLYVTIVNGKMMGSMPVQFPVAVNCWCEGETAIGSEVSYFGSLNNGYVYKLDDGPDFDGANVYAYLKLNFNPQGQARVLKRYRRGSLEITGTGYASFDFGYSLGYDSPDIDQAPSISYSVPFSVSSWDNFTWDNFTWDGRTLAPSEADVNGTAENIAVVVSSNSRINQPFTLNSVTLHYTPRRGIR